MTAPHHYTICGECSTVVNPGEHYLCNHTDMCEQSYCSSRCHQMDFTRAMDRLGKNLTAYITSSKERGPQYIVLYLNDMSTIETYSEVAAIIDQAYCRYPSDDATGDNFAHVLTREQFMFTGGIMDNIRKTHRGSIVRLHFKSRPCVYGYVSV